MAKRTPGAKNILNKKLEHYGPEPHFGIGREMTHYMIHERAVGKTISAVYYGEYKPFYDKDSEETHEGVFCGDYLVLEFTDGTALHLAGASGHSFCPMETAESKAALAAAHK